MAICTVGRCTMVDVGSTNLDALWDELLQVRRLVRPQSERILQSHTLECLPAMRLIDANFCWKCGALAVLGTAVLWCDHYLTSKQAVERFGAESNLRTTSVHQDPKLNVSAILQAPPQNCVSIQFGDREERLTIAEAVKHIKSRGCSDPGNRNLSVGLFFVEHPELFSSLAKGFFHYFHFLEFLVVAYEELHHLAASCRDNASYVPLTGSTSLARGMPSLSVPWMYHPYMTSPEICGVADGLNCLAADLVLQGNVHHGARTTAYGLTTNDAATMELVDTFRKSVNMTVQYTATPADLTREVDAVMMVDRAACVDTKMHKMWTTHIEDFPAQAWHGDASQALANAPPIQPPSPIRPGTLVVAYVDRQDTRRPMPDDYHQWLVDTLSNHDNVTFWHLHMQDYEPLHQIQLAAASHVWIGAHGNGLSHALWMKPGSRIVEYFWNYDFYFDYATLAELMGHEYMGFFNGEVLDPVRIAQHDKALRLSVKKPDMSNMTAFNERVERGKQALLAFLIAAAANVGAT